MDEKASYSEITNQRKTFVLEKKVQRTHKVHTRRVTNFVRARLRTQDLKNLKYAQFEPLYEMWCEYYSNILNVTSRKPDERILKADYHGCLMMVSEADNPSQVGLNGIVARETRQTFQLITKADRLITIPKQGTTFRFAFEGKVFTLIGDAFRFPPPLRVKKMAKCRNVLPFFLK